MSFYKDFLTYLPEVKEPVEKGTLKKRLMWTGGILLLFLFLSAIPIYGIVDDQADYFETLELLMGAKIGKLMTLGIGPIVTASIVLQLLKGSGIISFDMQSEEGKFLYNGTLKLLTFIFVIIQSIAFVAFGGIVPYEGLANLVIIQLAIGGFLVFYMDQIIKKWGFGSGVSLFIAAGIGQAVFLQLFSPLTDTGDFAWPFGGQEAVGALWASLYFLSAGDPVTFAYEIAGPVLITVFLFFLIVFFQSINVEIPLSFGRVRGQGIRWPLNFFYAGVIPVILISALGMNIQMWARFLQNSAEDAGASGFTVFLSERIFGQFTEEGAPQGGLVNWITPVDIWENLGNLLAFDIWFNIITYTLYLVIGATLFSYLWVVTAGMDSKSVAKQIVNSGLQIPGFRKDNRIIERILSRYIIPLTLMGGVAIGVIASAADVLSALTSGTGILLLVMIIYNFYQQLARESMEDFSLLKKLMKR